ncbi:hypothetical protein PAPHI01_1073 [Pancytospora philotis]|nr:hypothetical protein PAPHI01_1073 [Pancytospora philotis]
MLGAIVLLAACICKYDHLEGRTRKEWIGLISPDKQAAECSDTEFSIVHKLVVDHINKLKRKGDDIGFDARILELYKITNDALFDRELDVLALLKFIASLTPEAVSYQIQQLSMSELFAVRNFVQRSTDSNKYCAFLTADEIDALDTDLNAITERLHDSRVMKAGAWYRDNKSDYGSDLALWTLHRGRFNSGSSLSKHQVGSFRTILKLILDEGQPASYVRSYLDGIMQFCSSYTCSKQLIGCIVLDVIIKTRRFELFSLFRELLFGRPLLSFLKAKCDACLPAESANSYIDLFNNLLITEALSEKALAECIMLCYWRNHGPGDLFDPQFYALDKQKRLAVTIWIIAITRGQHNSNLNCYQLDLAKRVFSTHSIDVRVGLLVGLAVVCKIRSLEVFCSRIYDAATLSTAVNLCETNKFSEDGIVRAMHKIFQERLTSLNKF